MIKVNSGNLRTYWRGLLFFLLLGVPFLIALMVKRHRIKMNTINKIGKEIYLQLLEAGFGLYQARYITAQAAHETGNFTSKIFEQNNNLFGMKLPALRRTTATGQSKGHATYENISDSIKDFQIYYNHFRYLSDYPTIESYVKALKRNKYFEADEQSYLDGCKHFYKLYFNG